MGTLFRIELYAPTESSARSSFAAAFARIAQLDAILSDYQPGSELNQICTTAVNHPVKVSADLFAVLLASQHIAQKTAGAFDITLGPVIRLWRQARQEHRLPDSDHLREAATRCGYRKLHLDPTARTVLLDQAGMQLDVGGIAKGWTAEAALTIIKHRGIRSALVAASGDLACSDAPPGQRGWKIGLGSDDRTVLLSHCAVSTSGASEQFLEIDGTRYSHIIDPATNLGLTRDITVTVVAPHGAAADSLALAVSILAPASARSLIEAEPGTAALVLTHAHGTVEIAQFGATNIIH